MAASFVICMVLAPFGHWPVRSILNRFVPKNLQITSRSIRPGGIMAVGETSKYEEYRFYAEHCLELVRIATNRKSRIIQRQMAAEVQAGRYVLCCGTTCKMMMEAASVGGLFHFKPSVQCRLLALRDISLGCRIGSLSEQSGHGPTCCRLNSVGNDPTATSHVGRTEFSDRATAMPLALVISVH